MISIIAVIILLIVTNSVFHKYYWTGWNARLRDLSKAAQKPRTLFFESLALVGVGFMTIFREGFKTTLFLQSLILEAGIGRPVGLAIGSALIAALGFAVFLIGVKLPYRKISYSQAHWWFSCSSRSWDPPCVYSRPSGGCRFILCPGLSRRAWAGLWLGLYPTWEESSFPLGRLPTWAQCGSS